MYMYVCMKNSVNLYSLFQYTLTMSSNPALLFLLSNSGAISSHWQPLFMYLKECTDDMSDVRGAISIPDGLVGMKKGRNLS